MRILLLLKILVLALGPTFALALPLKPCGTLLEATAHESVQVAARKLARRHLKFTPNDFSKVKTQRGQKRRDRSDPLQEVARAMERLLDTTLPNPLNPKFGARTREAFLRTYLIETGQIHSQVAKALDFYLARELSAVPSPPISDPHTNPRNGADPLARLNELLVAPYEDFDRFDLPTPVRLSVEPIDALAMFQLALSAWQSCEDCGQVKMLLDKPENLELFKQVRKKALLLRYVFMAFDQSHKPPKILNRFVKELGQMNDALANGLPEVGKLHAEAAKNILSQGSLNLELQKFTPDKGPSIHKQLGNLANRIRQILLQTQMTIDQFHTVRKHLRQVQAVMRLIYATEPTQPFKALIARLHALNEETGRLHDLAVGQALRGERDYGSVTIEMPADLAFDLDRALQATGL